MQAERKGLGSLEGSTVLGVCGVLIAHRLQAGLEGKCGTDFALEIRNHFRHFFWDWHWHKHGDNESEACETVEV